MAGLTVNAQATMPDEYEVRAAIVLNLAKFVTWPQGKAANPHAPFVVGLLGYDQQGAALEKFLGGRSVEGRPVAVRRLTRGDRTDDCFLIYVASPERKHYEDLEAQMAKDGVLTVSDDERFVLNGGVVGLPVAGDHIEIQINLAQAQRSGLTISSRLLHLATVVSQ
jgi:hypothetical protein